MHLLSLCAAVCLTEAHACHGASWISPSPGAEVANVVNLTVDATPLPGEMFMGVRFWAREQAQGGHSAPPFWTDVGSGTAVPSHPGWYSALWHVTNWPHNGYHDLKADITYVRFGMPPSSYTLTLTTTATVANALISCTTTQQVTPDPGVLKWVPPGPCPEIGWFLTGAFGLDTVLSMSVTIYGTEGSAVRTYSISPPTANGSVTWDGLNDMGVPAPKGLYAVGAQVVRAPLHGHGTRQCDVALSGDGQHPVCRPWENMGAGSAKFRFDYQVTDGLHLGADAVVATLFRPDMVDVESHNLVPAEGTHETYVTFAGVPKQYDGDWRFALTYSERSPEHSRFNKDHAQDFGYPLFPSFHIESAIDWQGPGFGTDASLAAVHQRDEIASGYWYAATDRTGATATELRAAVGGHPAAIFFHRGHGDEGDPGLIQSGSSEWVLCGYDASAEHNLLYHGATQPQPIASANPGYQWDLSQCKLFITAACFSADVRYHGYLPAAALSRGADTAVAFHDYGPGIGTPWADWFWGSLCVGKEHFGYDPTGPLQVCQALQFARERMEAMYGSPVWSDHYIIEGDEHQRIVP